MFLRREECVMKSQRREKMARRSISYMAGDVYHDAGRARTGFSFVEAVVEVSLAEAPKLK